MRVIFLVPLYQSKKFLSKWFYYVHRLNPKPDKIYFCCNICLEDIDIVIKYCKMI